MKIGISDKKIKSIFYVFLTLAFILVIMAYVISGDSVVSDSCETCKPTTMKKMAGGVEEFTFVPKKYPMELNTIAFFTSHQFVEVYGDDELIYSFNKDVELLGHTPGCNWNFVPIEDGVKTVTVRLTPAYASGKYQKCVFYHGAEMDIFLYLFRKALPSFLASMMILLLGIGLMILWAVMKKTTRIGRSFLYLGIFSTLFGIWSANETDIATLLIPNRIGSYFMAYIALMLLVTPFIFFAREFFRIGDNKIWKIFAILNFLEIIVVLALQFLGKYELRETLFLTHILLFIGVCYMIGCVLYKIIKHKVDNRVRATIFSIILIVIAVFIDIYAYYYRIGDSDLFGRFVFLIFIIVLTFETATETLSVIKKGRKAAEYQKLADTDALTNMHSRSSYERAVQNSVSCQNTMIVSFDLNNLKRCNDRYGHKKGDEYIINSAKIIKKVFNKYGTIYRIGGDEFVCIITKADKCPIDKCLAQLKEEELKYNSSGQKYYGFEIQIACGYAVYNPMTDADLEATRNRSDFMMYENKAAIKGK